jgi:hypothetical protein
MVIVAPRPCRTVGAELTDSVERMRVQEIEVQE